MMNELDKVHLQKRLNELHEQRLKESPSMDEDLGMETGYVTDSSVNSRKGIQSSYDSDPVVTAANKSRKTKSERDKRRSSRVSLLESKNDSGSENSSENATEEKQHRYRKRAGSKRVETQLDVSNKENLDVRQRRAGSKASSQNPGNRSSIQVHDDQKQSEKTGEQNSHTPQTLRMNKKDIYFGTWNPNERAVLDQVLNNIDLKSDTKKSFIGKFKWGNKDKLKMKEKCRKIEEDIEEEDPYEKVKKDKNFPNNENEINQKKNNTKVGIFRKLKESVKQRHLILEEAYVDRKLQNYGISPSPSQKKRGLFSRLSSKRKEEGSTEGRARAHSSNDYARCVGVFIQTENTETKADKNEKPIGNLSKTKSGSIKNLFSTSRAKSVNNLNGAFEYYANPKQVFQRTPSMSKLNSRSTSMDKLDQSKRSSSQKSLDHAFEPVKYTSKELCYNDPLVYAQARFVQPQTANQRNICFPRQSSIDGFCSNYEDDYYRGYQSDVSPSIPNGQHRHFTSDIPYPYSDTERVYSSMSAHHPVYFQTPPPPRRVASKGYYQLPPHHPSVQPMSPYFMPTQHALPMPGYYTPGYATPGIYHPQSGYGTPTGMQSGYTSESDYGYVQSPYFQRCGPMPPQNNHPMMFQARKAIQRSLSKNSSTSNYSGNYGYGSESSFCEEEIYSMVRPPPQQSSPQYYEQRSNSSRASKTSQLSTNV